jgi:hypothetical protein
MSSIEMRLAALENTVAELKTENELLKMLTPLEAITEGLKAATPEEVASWMAACEAASGKMKKKAKAPKEEKNTNPTGPAEFNILIQAVWHEMAADAGVVGEHDDAFKKASKEVGVTFQKARAEASRRKAEMEGKPAPVPKAPKTPKAVASPKAVAAPKAVPKTPVSAPKAVPSAPKKAAPSAKPTAEQILAATPDYDDEMRARMKAECEGYGWECRIFEGKACWLNPSDGDVFSYDGVENVGIYDAAADEFCAA